METLNDVHSKLNETVVARVIRVESLGDIILAVDAARREGKAVSIAAGRYAMGGQQFGAGAIQLDMRSYNRILGFDGARGLVEVQAGIEWPQLVSALLAMQQEWGIVQKQTGADRLSIGGALSANIHGRGLTIPPLVAQIDSFTIVDAHGAVRRCSRDENRELFSLAIGGYGLFGVINTVTLRLGRRRKVRRVVEVRPIEGLMDSMHQRIDEGFLYGDFQFATDEQSPAFLREGVFSCYEPVPEDTPETPDLVELSEEQWAQLFQLAHFEKSRAFELYAKHYLATSGQVYWSDTHQLSVYIDDYHGAVDARCGQRGSEVITELFVPRHRLADFMESARAHFLSARTNVFYGTIRLVERDDESFLAWAREPYACVIFNLHVEHTTGGLARATATFRRLIDLAIERGGSYYLTYHRWARRDQVERGHPRFAGFLAAKRRFDPEERFQSEWYRHYREMFS